MSPSCNLVSRTLPAFASGAQDNAFGAAGRLEEVRQSWRQQNAWSRSARFGSRTFRPVRADQEFLQDKAGWRQRLAPYSPGALFLSRFKAVLVLLLKLKFVLSLVAATLFYCALFGWKIGAGLLLAASVHEAGHALTVRRLGLRAEWPVFLPGVRAFRRYLPPACSAAAAEIALAGVLSGLLFTIACGTMGRITDSRLLQVVACLSAWLNGLNLAPILGGDGAKATLNLRRSHRSLLALLSLILWISLQQGIFLLVGLAMLYKVWRGEFPEQTSRRPVQLYALVLCQLAVVLLLFPMPRIAR